MPSAIIPAVIPASPDISSILASLGVFSLAVAAVVGGIYKGIKEVKKGGADTGTSLAGGIIMDRASITTLTESMERLATSHRDIIELLRSVDRTGSQLVEAIKDNREMTRSQIEEQHRLRAATVDLVDMMRRRAP